MDRQESKRRKVAIVGAGAVGSTFAYSLAQSGLADDIVLIDKNEDLARGQVLDLAHGQPFFPTVAIEVGGPEDYADARLIVITAGASQNPGQSRLDLMKKNAAVMRSICKEIVARNSEAVVLIVTNPVDVMTSVALEATGLPKERVIGSGTVLDSARLRHIMSKCAGVDVHNVHGYVLGEHGDSEFVAWSMTHIAGMQIDKYCPICGRCEDWQAKREEIQQQVRKSAYHIIGYKGATWFGVGLALARIAGAVLRGQSSVLTVSATLNGEFGINGISLSVPCIVSNTGVQKILKRKLPLSEQKALESSAETLHKAMETL